MEDKYVASFILHAVGDMIGFKNGEWEFNFFSGQHMQIQMTNEILFDYIYLGGINGIDFSDWMVSDDTILNIATAKGLLSNDYVFDENMVKNLKKEFVIANDAMYFDGKHDKERYPGKTTMRYIEMFKKGKDGRTEKYDPNAGGNGASMRLGPIGLMFHGEKNRKKLIDASIQVSKLTHNSAIGYLGGLVTALFTAFAIEKIEIKKWPFIAINFMKSQDVKKYIKNDEEYNDYEIFLLNWDKYVDTRFDKQKNPIVEKSHKNLIFRSNYHYKLFTSKKSVAQIGASGYSSTIMAYDGLLDCNGKWETLVIYTGLHLGDSDTVCAIAAFWYGAYFGFGDVPKSNYETLEYKKELIECGKKMFKHYYK
jgi:ADP-ribosylglycohydrolase